MHNCKSELIYNRYSDHYVTDDFTRSGGYITIGINQVTFQQSIIILSTFAKNVIQCLEAPITGVHPVGNQQFDITAASSFTLNKHQCRHRWLL